MSNSDDDYIDIWDVDDDCIDKVVTTKKYGNGQGKGME